MKLKGTETEFIQFISFFVSPYYFENNNDLNIRLCGLSSDIYVDMLNHMDYYISKYHDAFTKTVKETMERYEHSKELLTELNEEIHCYSY